jgi:enoyl-[acyl-carrier protein] reductase II
MAGQSVGLADRILPLKGIFDEIVTDAETEFQKIYNLMKMK